jgi:hypothetical protein
LRLPLKLGVGEETGDITHCDKFGGALAIVLRAGPAEKNFCQWYGSVREQTVKKPGFGGKKK